MEINVTDIEYEDGCYSGLVVIVDREKVDGIHECISFVYDKEIAMVNIVSRLYPSFKAPILNELPKFVVNNYDYLMLTIKEKCEENIH